MAKKAIVGEKLGMTQVWDDDNNVVPVTVLRVTPARVVQLRTPERDGYSALQVTYGNRDARKLNKPTAGQYAVAGVDPGVKLLELRLEELRARSEPSPHLDQAWTELEALRASFPLAQWEALTHGPVGAWVRAHPEVERAARRLLSRIRSRAGG